MIQTTRWSPDTCGCVHEYTWDDSVPATARVHTAGKIVHQCPAHLGLAVAAHLTALLDENPRKNKIIGAILTQVPSLILDDITWAFNASRTLVITAPKLTAAQKSTLQALADATFGSGHVLFA